VTERALIFANGDPYPGEMVRRILADAGDAHIIAADGGARMARFYGYTPHVILGDMDSLSSSDLTFFEQAGAALERFPAEKAETDLELALQYAARKGITWLRIIGAVGNRFDQTIANVHLLTLPELVNVDAGMVSGGQAIYVLRPGLHTFHGQPGDTISLIPLSASVADIETKDLKYPLNKETLYFGPARGVSNVLDTADTGQVSFPSGMLLAVHTVGRA
jgi:thiamine pyrophosphokinase